MNRIITKGLGRKQKLILQGYHDKFRIFRKIIRGVSKVTKKISFEKRCK